MIRDSGQKIGRAAVMQEEDSLTESPQRSGAELIAAGTALRNIVSQAAAHVMNLKIREGFYRCIAQ